MKIPGVITGCTNPFHAHLADVAENMRKMSQCTFADPPDVIELGSMSRMEARALVDSIRAKSVPGMHLESFMLKLVKLLDKGKPIG